MFRWLLNAYLSGKIPNIPGEKQDKEDKRADQRLHQRPTTQSQKGLVNTSVIPLKLSVYLQSRNHIS